MKPSTAILSALLLGTSMATPALAETKTAIFAGGCFWCIEKDFEHVKGVVDVISGYTGGNSDNPTYKNHTKYKHREAVQIAYDPAIVSYESLLKTFWRTVDPTDGGGQFCDRGFSYSTAIYFGNKEEMKLAEAQKSEIDASGILPRKIATSIEPAATFFPSEGYHQNYYKKNPIRYKFYRSSCGRDSTVERLWGKEAYKGVSGHEQS